MTRPALLMSVLVICMLNPIVKLIHTKYSRAKKMKRKKYLETCLQILRDFTPFVFSVDVLFGEETKNVIKRLVTVLSEQWTRPYSSVCDYLNTRFLITALHAIHMCLRENRIPADKISNRIPQWENGTGLYFWY